MRSANLTGQLLRGLGKQERGTEPYPLTALIGKNGSSALQRAARTAAARLRKAGYSEVTVHQMTADGKAVTGGTRAHLTWNPVRARLIMEMPGGKTEVLAALRNDPQCLEPYSPSTRAAGVSGAVVIRESEKDLAGSLKGKIVCLETVHAIFPGVAALLKKKGAAGLICGPVTRTGRGISETGITLNHDLLNSPFPDGSRLPVFHVSRQTLTAIRKQRNARIRMECKTEMTAGTVPVVTARLAGTEKMDIYLAPVMAEVLPVLQAPVPGMPPYAIDLERPGEIALAAEAGLGTGAAAAQAMDQTLHYACTLGRVMKKKKALRRSVRVYLSFGTDALKFYLNGCYEEREGSRSRLHSVLHIAPAAAKDTAVYSNPDTADNYQELVMLKQGRTGIREGLTAVGAQFAANPHGRIPVFAVAAGDPYRPHTGLAAFTGLLFWVADAGYREARALAKEIYAAAPGNGGAAWAQKHWVNLARLSETGPWCLTPARRRSLRKKGLYVKGYLFRRIALEVDMKRWYAGLAADRPKSGRKKPVAGKLMPVPLYLGAGPFGKDTLSAKQLTLLKRLGYDGEMPLWMHRAAALAMGKKPVYTVAGQIAAAGSETDLKKLSAFYELLKGAGLVRYRKVVTGAQIKNALRRAGVKKGDTLVAHVGLMTYGYVPGGPKEIIRTLMDAVGPEGNIFMPGHSLSWVGNTPYDPAASNGIAGVITNIFRTLPGVKRSLHPTHSVAGYGPDAEKFLAGHDENMGPFDKKGFWGKFYRANGKILLFCDDKLANTFLHCVDVWNGTPMPTIRAHYMRNGKRYEADIPEWPFYGDAFKHIYGPMWKKNQISKVNLGEDTVYYMASKDAFNAGAPIMRKNPLYAIPLPDSGRDYYSRYMRREVARRQKGKKKG